MSAVSKQCNHQGAVVAWKSHLQCLGVIPRIIKKSLNILKIYTEGCLIIKSHIYLSVSYILNAYNLTKMAFQLKTPPHTFHN